MEYRALNASLRLMLELFALVVYGVWGWRQVEGWPAYLLAGAVPLAAAGLWGVFAVPGDPSRSGRAPVPVPGWLRLILELTLFALAGAALINLGAPLTGTIFSLLVIVHYGLAWERIRWLFEH